MPAPGAVLAGRYRIISPLGAGAMATVHRARDERLERDVAVKVLLPNHAGDPILAARFEREARSLAAAAHPGVVAVFDVDPGDPAAGVEPFFVMELCEGGSLADRLAGGHRLSPDELLPILISVADGLAGLHASGVVHRDVKPSNILLAPARAKLADFGLARSDDAARPSDLTASGTAVGTMSYLAPDVLAGHPAGPPGDVYALGVVAFVGLTGTLPRATGSIAELVVEAGRPAPVVSSAAPDLGRAFDGPVAAALDPDPTNRPTAETLAAQLTTALGNWSRSRSSATSMDGSVPSDPDAMTAVVPVAAVPVQADSRVRPVPSPDGPGSAVSRRNLVAAALLGGLIVAVLALAATRSPGATQAGGTNPPSASALIASSPPASASIPATLAPTPSIVARALKALDNVDAAIEASGASAPGPGGPKKDAGDFARRARDIRSALERADLDAAAKDADGLAKAVSKASGGPKGEPDPALDRAIADLIQILDDR